MKVLREKIESNILWKALFCCAFLGNTISNLWLIDIFQDLVNSVTSFNKVVFNQSIKYFILALAINIIFIILDQYFFRSVSNYGEMNLKKYTYNNYLLNVASTENNNAGKIVSRINSDVPIISNWISMGRMNTYLQIVYLIICLTIMLNYSLEIAIITVLIIAIMFLLSRYFSIQESKCTKQFQNSFEVISDKIYNSFLNLKTIKQLRKQEYFAKKIKKISLDSTENQVKGLSKYMALNEAMLGLMTDVLPLITFFFGVLLTTMGKLSIGTAFSIMLVAQKLNEPIIILAELLVDKKNAEQVYERIHDIYEENSNEESENLRDAELFQNYSVEIKEFAYTESEKFILKDVYFNVNRGDLFIIKGESGKGKSTLLRLIANLLTIDHKQGMIKYNDENIKKINFAEYHKHVLLVEQNTVIIEGSLEENILLGDCFPKAKLNEAIYVSKLNDFYKEKGANYIIKENGKNISGGERQRISLARMILRNPEILILDEVTSSLDKEIRCDMISRLMDYKKKNDVTIIAVTHNDDFDFYNPKMYML